MELSSRHKTLIFIVLTAGCILGSTVQTALNVALTPIMEEMQLAASTVQWLTSLYSLVMGVMVLSTAFLIRRVPSRTLFLVSVGSFTVGLLLSALAVNFPMLLAGRILQALGCGAMTSLTQVVILSIFPASRRGTLMGIFGLAVSAAPVLAPTIAGIVNDLWGWRVIFWGSLVLALLVWALGFATMRNLTETQKLRFDLPSLLLCAVGFVGVLLGLGNSGSHALLSWQVLGLLLVGLAALGCFVWRQLRLDTPFLNLQTFRNREFRLAVIASMLLYLGLMGASTLLPLYLQSIRGFSATTSGLVTMPGSLVTAALSLVAGRLYDKLGVRKLYLAGAIALVLGSAAMALMGAATPLAYIVAAFCLRQVGIGMLMMTSVTWGMSTLPKAQTSDGTALINSLRTMAGAVGSAVFVAVMTIAAGGSDTAAMLHGAQIAFIGIAATTVVLLVLAVTSIGRSARK